MTALEFAIELELDAERYYNEQSDKAKHPGLKSVFKLLAEEEREHAELLERYAAKKAYDLKESRVPKHYESIYQDLKDLDVEYKGEPAELDAYKLALEKEQESIDLYGRMLADATTEEEKKLFKFLIAQEKIHYNTFADIIEHLRKGEQWVESAEFGLREEY